MPGPVFLARISRPACGPCWPGPNGPGGPPPAPARSSTTGARPRAASWPRTGPRIARPEGGDPHDAVRGAGRPDHGGDGGARAPGRGGAALLASPLPQPELQNRAPLGARAADVERLQLPAATALRPDV